MLTIPTHWKFNFPLLMGHLKKGPGGHLLRTATGHLSKACSAGCVCSVEQYPGCGSCTDTHYGTPYNQGNATVTIAGSSTPYVFTAAGCAAPATCPSIMATYIIPCGSSNVQYWIAQYVCTSGGRDYYYVMGAKFNYPDVYGRISIVLQSDYGSLVAGSPNPNPTLSTTAIGMLLNTNRQRTLLVGTSATFNVYRYVLGGTCDVSCNTVITRPECQLASPSTASDTTNYGGSFSNNGCSLSGHTVSVSIAI